MDEAEKEKLRILLGYWIEHNREHGEEFKEWAEKSRDLGEAMVCEDLLDAVQHMDKANEFLLRALRKLRG